MSDWQIIALIVAAVAIIVAVMNLLCDEED